MMILHHLLLLLPDRLFWRLLIFKAKAEQLVLDRLLLPVVLERRNVHVVAVDHERSGNRVPVVVLVVVPQLLLEQLLLEHSWSEVTMDVDSDGGLLDFGLNFELLV